MSRKVKVEQGVTYTPRTINRAGSELGLRRDRYEDWERWCARVLGGIEETQELVEEHDREALILSRRLERAKKALAGQKGKS